MSDVHPLIALFQAQAEVLDATGQVTHLDDAIAKLAGWMELVEDDLTEDDMAVLAEIGGILYREGLNRRMGGYGVQRKTRRGGWVRKLQSGRRKKRLIFV